MAAQKFPNGLLDFRVINVAQRPAEGATNFVKGARRSEESNPTWIAGVDVAQEQDWSIKLLSALDGEVGK
jgi:hypothetical protein